METDDVNDRAVVEAHGRDARGNGTASARVIAMLSKADGITTVIVRTELDLTGKPAQFGRGMIVEVSNRLFEQFAGTLAAKLRAGVLEPVTTEAIDVDRARRSSSATAAPISVAALVGPALAKRVAIVLLGLLLVAVLTIGIGRGRRSAIA